MPICCIVVSCRSNSNNEDCSFFRIPKGHPNHSNFEFAKKQGASWLEAINRDDLTNTKFLNARVCSKHFISGKPAKATDINNVDWAPSQNMGHSATPLVKRQSSLVRQRRPYTRRNQEIQMNMRSLAVNNSAADPLKFNYPKPPSQLRELLGKRNVTINKPPLSSNVLEDSYTVKIDMDDGSSQLVGVSMAQNTASTSGNNKTQPLPRKHVNLQKAHVDKSNKGILTRDQEEETDYILPEQRELVDSSSDTDNKVEDRLKKKVYKKYPKFKCRTCKIVVNGYVRLATHFRKYPMHRQQPSRTMLRDCSTWNVLIETALKGTRGNCGKIFCDELITLIHNVQLLANYFLKPTTDDESNYFINDLLANVLNVKTGNYKFNESVICNDPDLISYLVKEDFLEVPLHEDILEPEPKAEFIKTENVFSAEESEKLKRTICEEHRYSLLPSMKRLKSSSRSVAQMNKIYKKQSVIGKTNIRVKSKKAASPLPVIKQSEHFTQSHQQQENVGNEVSDIMILNEYNDNMKVTIKEEKIDEDNFEFIEFLTDNSPAIVCCGSDNVMTVDKFVDESCPTELDGINIFGFNS